MRSFCVPVCFLTLSLLCIWTDAHCVMFGMCSKKNYCVDSRPALSVPGDLRTTCESDSPVQCCNKEQLEKLSDSLYMLAFVVRDNTDNPTCYNGLRQIFCDMTCSPRQSELVTVTGNTSNGSVTSIDFSVSLKEAQRIFNACAQIEDFFLGKAISVICNQEDCDMKTFFRSLGTPEEQGGRSPYGINFVFTDDIAANTSNKQDESVNTSPNNTDQLPAEHWELKESADQQSPVNPRAVEEPAPAGDPVPVRRVYDQPLGLAMLLTFLGLTLFFLAGLAIRWCVERQADDNVVGSYSPPIGCYSKVGATIQFGSTWLFARQGALVARFPKTTLLLTFLMLAIMCCGFLRFRVTTDPVDLWSDPKSRARLEKAYFDEHFGPFHRTEQLIIRPINSTPFVRNGQIYGPVFGKQFLQAVLDLQTKVVQVRTRFGEFGGEVKLTDICYKPLEPVSEECGVFSPLEYFQSNATLLDAVSDSKDYLDHLKFCTKLIAADNGPLGSCRGRSGVPMFGNVVFGGIKEDNYMEASAVVITILVENAVDHDSTKVRMAKAWEGEFIKTVLAWREAHPDVVVNFAAERSVEDEIIRQSHSDISTIIISYAIMVIYVSICLGNYRGFRTCLVDLKISLSIGGVSIVLASIFSSIGLWSFVGVPATLIIIEVIPFLVLAVGVDNIFIMVQDFAMHEEEGEEEEEDEEIFGSQDSLTDGERDGASRRQSGKHASGTQRSSVEMRISKTMGRVGPSIFLSSLAESVAFFCGAFWSRPCSKIKKKMDNYTFRQLCSCSSPTAVMLE
uniref:SSD domain-containing protein n=1 Tax=Mesocestoides corti TaxID=53468 RepID=A0A5K3F6K7_MESCO